jgi:hypothetical protein
MKQEVRTVSNDKPPIAKRAIVDKYADLELPTVRSEPSARLQDYSWLIFGAKKIGKTALVSRFGKTIFFQFEPGYASLAVYKTELITDWGMAKHYVKKLKEVNRFTMACIDPGNTAYDRCLEWKSKQLNIQHPGKVKDYGASWKAVNEEFQSFHRQLAALGLGVTVICHERIFERETFDGVQYDYVGPKLSEGTEEYYAGTTDIIAHYHYVGDKRYLQIRGDQYTACGLRCDTPENPHFRTVNGDEVYKIPMGSSVDEAYSNVLRAFNNEQKRANRPEDLKGGVAKKKKDPLSSGV